MKIKFSNLVKMFLAGACFVAVGCSDYSQDIENLNNRVNLLESNKIEPLKTALDDVKTALESAQADLQGKINTNTTAIGELEAALEQAKASNAKDINEIRTDIDDLYDAVAGKVDSDLFEENLTNIMAAIAALEAKDATFEEYVADYLVFVEEVEAEKARLQNEIDLLKAKDVELEGLIAAIDERLTANEALAAANKQDLEATKETLTLLNEAFVKFTTEEFVQYKEVIATQLAEHFAAFNQFTADALDKFTELYAMHEEQTIRMNGIDTKIDEINAAFEAFQGKMTEVVETLADSIALNQEAIYVNAQEISKLKEAIDSITSRLDKIESELNALADYVYNTITEDIKALNGDVDALKGRIQSLVFVPNNVYGDAIINHAVLEYNELSTYARPRPGHGDNDDQKPEKPENPEKPEEPEYVTKTTFVECQSVLKFQVTPAACALALKDCDPKELSFVLTSPFATRGAEVPALEVVKVGLADAAKGIIDVYVNARNLGDSFYGVEADATETYAASLVLKNDLVNIASCYVNLAPAAESQVITVEMVEPTHVDYTMEWDTKDNVIALPEQKFAFNIVGGDTKEENITIENMIAKGYDIKVVKSEPVITFEGKKEYEKIFMNKINTDNPYFNYVYVNLNNADEKFARAAVGSVETIAYEYNVSGVTFVPTAKVEVVKISRTIEMRADNIVWNYHQDAESDAYDWKATERKASPAEIKSFPQDVQLTYDEVVKNSPLSVTVYDNGSDRNDEPVVAKNVTASFGGTAKQPTIDLKNFEWGKTYTVEAVYDFEDLTVVIKTRVTTENRVREVITIDLAKEEWTLTADFVRKSETKEENIYEALYNALVASKVNHAYNQAMDKAKFMKDVFENEKRPYADGVKVCIVDEEGNELEMKNTKLVHTDTYTFKSVYYVPEFSPVPEKVNYVYTIVTWYGQEIQIKKTLNIGLKDVVLTLEGEKVALAKDLVLETEPQSVAAIYDLVGKVDKENIDAATYLKKFFDGAVAKTFLVEDGEATLELPNTVLSVNKNEEGKFVAKAKFNYADFEKMPEKIVYKSSYTTWYGQKVTIVKEFVIDWYIYDFQYIPEFVYDNANGIYSIAKAHRMTDKENNLNGLEISLDLETAFDVVTTAGERLTQDELKELGLTVKYDVTTAPADKNIRFVGNKLMYHGYDKTVGVKGQLILTNTNGQEVPITTKFDVDPLYKNYYVKQYNPVSKFKDAKPLTIEVPKHAKKFTYFAANQLSLTDDRGYELITAGECITDTDQAIEFENATWTVGDGKNGFAAAVPATEKGAIAVDAANAAEIYGLEYTSFSCDTKNVPAKMIEQNVFSFDTVTGKLVFDNTNDIELTKPIQLEVTVGITHSWIEEETVTFKVLLQPVGEK